VEARRTRRKSVLKGKEEGQGTIIAGLLAQTIQVSATLIDYGKTEKS
jgi:hypothetical protein